MTNLEWIKTLSAEELADWFYDEWLPRLQYRWSSSRGGLIIWLKDHKDEPQNYCDDCLYTDTCDSKEFFYACTSKATISKMEQVDKDINVRSKTEPNSSEKPNNCETCIWSVCNYNKVPWDTDCNGCKFVGTYDTEFPCANCSRKTKDYYTKDEPQTERSE